MPLFFWDPNGDEPVYASGLLNGHLGSANDLSELAAYNMSGMPNKLKAHVPGYGIYYYENSSGYVSDGLYVINATGGGQWILDVANTSVSNATDLVELQTSELEIKVEDIEESVRVLDDEVLPKIPDIYTFKAWRSGITVAATSFQTITFTLSKSGINFNSPNPVQITPPLGYTGNLIQSQAYWRIQNTVETSFYNPTAGSLTIPGGEWIIVIFRSRSDVITIS